MFHFQINSPATHYKNKTNLYLLTHFSKKLGFKKAMWNFTEPSHGKNTADDVVEQLKAKAGKIVAHSSDINNAHIV